MPKTKIHETYLRSILKGMTARILEILVDTFILSFFIDVKLSLSLSVIVELTCFAVTYINERVWNLTDFGRIMKMAVTKRKPRTKEMKIELTSGKDGGEGTLRLGNKSISSIQFIYDDTSICITDISTDKKYRRMGYGTILMYVIMGIATAKKVPIQLYSLEGAVLFYRAMGMNSLHDWKDGNKHHGCRIIFANLNPKRTFEDQIEKNDLVWTPKGLKETKIYL